MTTTTGLITPEYLELMKEAHERYNFGVSGAQWLPLVLTMCRQYATQEILDYGCGQALLAKVMPYLVQNYDPAIEGLDAPPVPADIVVCTDVLEHIEPECLPAVLQDLRRLTKKAGLFVAATRKAGKVLADGRNAHLIIKPHAWWREEVIAPAGFKIVQQATGRKGEAMFHVE